MSKAVYRGIVKRGTVVLRKAAHLPEGAEVLVTPVGTRRGSPQAVLTAIDAPPRVKPEDVDQLIRLIDEGKRLIRYDSPLAPKREW